MRERGPTTPVWRESMVARSIQPGAAAPSVDLIVRGRPESKSRCSTSLPLTTSAGVLRPARGVQFLVHPEPVEPRLDRLDELHAPSSANRSKSPRRPSTRDWLPQNPGKCSCSFHHVALSAAAIASRASIDAHEITSRNSIDVTRRDLGARDIDSSVTFPSSSVSPTYGDGGRRLGLSLRNGSPPVSVSDSCSPCFLPLRMIPQASRRATPSRPTIENWGRRAPNQS